MLDQRSGLKQVIVTNKVSHVQIELSIILK